jgi:hypothetical protein
MKTAAFVPFWSEGKSCLLSYPPDADISIVEGGILRQVVAVMEGPVLTGGASFTYTIKVLQGDALN